MGRLLTFIGFLAVVVGIGAAVFFFGGYYSVAATSGEPGIVKWALIQVRQASVSHHAKDVMVPPEKPEDVQAGARAYATRGCVNCHGGPGVDWGKWSEGLNPDPPDLKEVTPHRERGELFWVLKNGIKMTAMPSFGATGTSDEELWKIVSFLKKLPAVTAEEYKAWTAQP